MSDDAQVVAPGPDARTVRGADGRVLAVPLGWQWLAPGDAALTRRVKLAGPHWAVQEQKGRKVLSRGIWAPESHIVRIRAALAGERSTTAYATRRASDARRRDQKQTAYVEDFRASVLMFLRFSTTHAPLAERLADAVTLHATPVGSGTVARTQRIPLEQRAESAVIAWLRHQTTTYDAMPIARIKGERRKVRRMLAEQSRQILEAYRNGRVVDPQRCPLRLALARLDANRISS